MLWFLFTLVGLASLVALWRTRGRRGTAGWRLGCFASIGLFALAAVLWPGRTFAERMLTDLAMPTGAVWFGLLVTVLALAFQKRWRLALWLGTILLVLSIGGNGQFTGSVTRSLERDYIGIDPLNQGSFDVVCLLGGGATMDVNERIRPGSAGDRVVVASRLYHAGRTPLLLCTGGDLQGAPNLPNVAEESASVLVDLGVPRENILLGPGYNTKTEIAAIEKLKEEHNWRRVGVVTSAWHMARVERLAKGVGLDFVPLPADFRSGAKADLPLWDRLRRFSLIPKSSSLDESSAMLREKLAALVGR